MNKTDKIYIAGHRGMVGSAIERKLRKDGFNNIITRTSKELDLRNQQQVNDFFATEQPDYVFMSAAKVGGILANNIYRAEFIYDNLMIELNVVHACHNTKVKKMLFLGSSCIYPKMARQPLKEEYLLTGELEPTNEPYAIAKIAGIKLCESYRRQYGDNFISVMPTNLYGPNDNYDPENSHLFASFIRKFSLAKRNNLQEIEIWGDGTPMREFLHVDDMADACIFLMENYDGEEIFNIGTGTDVTVLELAETMKEVSGFQGTFKFDASKPNGTPRKLMDVSKLEALGWKAKISLKEGVKMVFDDVKEMEF
ncbi:GDP-L-fucose synthase [Vicingus serpentipes]|uniref:GDP-L-fucose synthase n=1 Tax=Vicingus serpentipes TaxID=1926625 RepID=A0A5C6RND6_9FLAO|nr:GDP-L-fucose synthase [Vicingus serpentipes]TXB63717.1 GDP-L-fucose synthase [Vicingus serpentipes]